MCTLQVGSCNGIQEVWLMGATRQCPVRSSQCLYKPMNIHIHLDVLHTCVCMISPTQARDSQQELNIGFCVPGLLFTPNTQSVLRHSHVYAENHSRLKSPVSRRTPAYNVRWHRIAHDVVPEENESDIRMFCKTQKAHKYDIYIYISCRIWS